MLVELSPVPQSAWPLGELAEHLRLSQGFADDGDLDGQLENCLRAAAGAIEGRTGKAILRRAFLQTVTQWSGDERHVFPVAPVASIDAVRIVDRVGATTVLDPASYQLVTDLHCPSLVAVTSLPTLVSGASAEIEFRAGYSEDWAGLPPDLKQAILMLAGVFFGQNEDVAAGFPVGVSALIEPYRTLRLRGAGA